MEGQSDEVYRVKTRRKPRERCRGAARRHGEGWVNRLPQESIDVDLKAEKIVVFSPRRAR
jgi:hypothetical protein